MSARRRDGTGSGRSETKLAGGTLYLGGMSQKTRCSDDAGGVSEIEIDRWEGVTATASCVGGAEPTPAVSSSSDCRGGMSPPRSEELPIVFNINTSCEKGREPSRLARFDDAQGRENEGTGQRCCQ